MMYSVAFSSEGLSHVFEKDENTLQLMQQLWALPQALPPSLALGADPRQDFDSI